MRSCVVVWTEKKSSFWGSPRDVFRRPSAAPETIAPKFLHTTFPSKYFVLAEFHPPRLSFGGVMPPTPSFASLQYGLPYSIWSIAIINTRIHVHLPFYLQKYAIHMEFYMKLSCRRETARCFASLKISLRHSRALKSFEMTPCNLIVTMSVPRTVSDIFGVKY